VTVNAALAHREKRAIREKREHPTADENGFDPAPPVGQVKRWANRPDDPVLAAEQHAIIEKAIAELPTSFRDVYVLADVEGLPNSEIGEMLGLHVPAVKSRLHRARLKMRDALAPHFEEVGA
jgi:RNA polymerase sigma-70 factor (ECF subfamily)